MHQESSWITEDRVRVYGLTIAVIELVGLCIVALRSIYFPGPDEIFSLGNDFRVFWAAAHITLTGDPLSLYSHDAIFSTMQSIDPSLIEKRAWHSWFYPPTYLLAILPLGAMPWSAAYVLFVGGSFGAYFALIHRLAKPYPVWWFVLGFPPVISAAVLGQNSLLTAVLAGVALLQMDRKPILAGLCIGLLAMKPHLAILFPVVLIASARWKVFWSAAITVAVFVAASVLVLGGDMALMFPDGVRAARAAVMAPHWPRLFMPTLYAGAVNLGMGEAVANALQLTSAIIAVVTVTWCWRQEASANARNAAFILATLMVSPHFFTYDLTWLALPIVWMAREGMRGGWTSGERPMLVFAWLAPMVLLVPATIIGANPAPFLPAVLLAYVAQRVRQQSRVPVGAPALG